MSSSSPRRIHHFRPRLARAVTPPPLIHTAQQKKCPAAAAVAHSPRAAISTRARGEEEANGMQAFAATRSRLRTRPPPSSRSPGSSTPRCWPPSRRRARRSTRALPMASSRASRSPLRNGRLGVIFPGLGVAGWRHWAQERERGRERDGWENE